MNQPAHAPSLPQHPEQLPSPSPLFLIRRITPADNAAMAHVIRTVMPEVGADGPGFAIHDAEVTSMYEAYQPPGAAYYVIERDGRVLGGAGYAPLEGGDASVCELKKMYFLPEARGHGLAKHILPQLMALARSHGYRTLYIESLHNMKTALALYHALGATPLSAPLGNTGHYSCNRFFTLPL